VSGADKKPAAWLHLTDINQRGCSPRGDLRYRSAPGALREFRPQPWCGAEQEAAAGATVESL